jgi:glycosyltransferase involved in cell wall biosynthesis
MVSPILIVIPHIEKGGGAEKVAYMLYNNFQASNIAVKIITFYKKENSYIDLDEQNCFDETPSKNPIINILKLFLRAKNIATIQKKYDAKIIISFIEEANFSSIISNLFSKKTVYVTSHTNPEVFLKNKIYRFLIKRLYPYSKNVVCVSKNAKFIFSKKFNLSNVKVIYNSVDQDEIKFCKKKAIEKQDKYLFSKEKKIVLTIGRLVDAKGHMKLLNSFKYAQEKQNNLRLIIIGEGYLKDTLEKQIEKLGLLEDVFLLGKKENIFPYLNHADSFVLSSLWEGFGLVLVEALSLGLPVLSTDCKTGPKEILFPGYSTKKILKYPLIEENRILAKPFSLYKSPDSEYKIFGELIIKSTILSRKTTDLDQFSKEVIMNQWKLLVNMNFK